MDRSFFLLAVIAATAAATLCSSEPLASPHSVECDGDTLIRQVVNDGDFKRLPLGAEHHFSLFKRRFGKSYATEEEHDLRFKIFKANMRQALCQQSFDPSTIHGVTQFSDLTPSEFREAFLGLRRNRLRLPVDTNTATILPTENLPIHFDWRERGAVTAVKNQDIRLFHLVTFDFWILRILWSFSTTGALEGANFLATGELVSLSEQQLVDCDHECDPEEAGSCDSGCNGGLMNIAFEYTLKAGCDREACKLDRSKIAASVANFSVISLDEDQIAANLVEHLVHSYVQRGWIMEFCWWVMAQLTIGSSKNSWGEKGYYRICRGRNICGVDSLVSTVAAVHTPIAAAGQ
ncbi:Cysteine protease RD19A, partial [Cucurbita argyrosperma subsp. argyrosperma]